MKFVFVLTIWVLLSACGGGSSGGSGGATVQAGESKAPPESNEGQTPSTGQEQTERLPVEGGYIDHRGIFIVEVDNTQDQTITQHGVRLPGNISTFELPLNALIGAGTILNTNLKQSVSHGELVINDELIASYTNTDRGATDDQFIFTVTLSEREPIDIVVGITIAPSGLGPIAQDDTYTGAQFQPVTLDVLLNDRENGLAIDSDSIEITTMPELGRASVTEGKIIYINEGTPGVDQIAYRVKSVNGEFSNIALVELETIKRFPVDEPSFYLDFSQIVDNFGSLSIAANKDERFDMRVTDEGATEMVELPLELASHAYQFTNGIERNLYSDSFYAKGVGSEESTLFFSFPHLSVDSSTAAQHQFEFRVGTDTYLPKDNYWNLEFEFSEHYLGGMVMTPYIDHHFYGNRDHIEHTLSDDDEILIPVKPGAHHVNVFMALRMTYAGLYEIYIPGVGTYTMQTSSRHKEGGRTITLGHFRNVKRGNTTLTNIYRHDPGTTQAAYMNGIGHFNRHLTDEEIDLLARWYSR